MSAMQPVWFGAAEAINIIIANYHLRRAINYMNDQDMTE